MKRKCGPKSRRPDKTTLSFLYYDMNCPVEIIARTYQVKKKTVYNWVYNDRKEELRAEKKSNYRLNRY